MALAQDQPRGSTGSRVGASVRFASARVGAKPSCSAAVWQCFGVKQTREQVWFLANGRAEAEQVVHRAAKLPWLCDFSWTGELDGLDELSRWCAAPGSLPARLSVEALLGAFSHFRIQDQSEERGKETCRYRRRRAVGPMCGLVLCVSLC